MLFGNDMQKIHFFQIDTRIWHIVEYVKPIIHKK